VQNEIDLLLSEGYSDIGVGMRAYIPGFSYRVFDLAATAPDGTYVGVEVKSTATGTIRLIPSQVQFDVALIRGSVGEGPPARDQFGQIFEAVRYSGHCIGCALTAAFQKGLLTRALDAANINYSVR
jgi:hypothetical protein